MMTDTRILFVFMPLGVLLAALVGSGLVLRANRAWLGYLVGLGVIALPTGFLVWSAIQACVNCGNVGLCCEWTGVGVVMFTGLGLVISAIFSALYSVLTVFYKKKLTASRRAFFKALGVLLGTVGLVTGLVYGLWLLGVYAYVASLPLPLVDLVRMVVGTFPNFFAITTGVVLGLLLGSVIIAQRR